MEAYKERMLDEWLALNEKLGKLNVFLDSKKFKELDKQRKKLLKRQRKYMIKYCYTLYKRLKLEGIDVTHVDSQ